MKTRRLLFRVYNQALDCQLDYLFHKSFLQISSSPAICLSAISPGVKFFPLADGQLLGTGRGYCWNMSDRKRKSNEANLPWAALQRKYYTLCFHALMCKTL